MRKQLKDIEPGMFIYTILIRSYGVYVTITVAKRRVRDLSRSGYYKTFEIITDEIKHDNFANKICFNSQRENDYLWHTGHFVYCFSEDVLMEELKHELKLVKLKIKENYKHFAANSFYRMFMPKLMKLIYTSKSGYVEMKTSDMYK